MRAFILVALMVLGSGCLGPDADPADSSSPRQAGGATGGATRQPDNVTYEFDPRTFGFENQLIVLRVTADEASQVLVNVTARINAVGPREGCLAMSAASPTYVTEEGVVARPERSSISLVAYQHAWDASSPSARAAGQNVDPRPAAYPNRAPLIIDRSHEAKWDLAAGQTVEILIGGTSPAVANVSMTRPPITSLKLTLSGESHLESIATRALKCGTHFRQYAAAGVATGSYGSLAYDARVELQTENASTVGLFTNGLSSPSRHATIILPDKREDFDNELLAPRELEFRRSVPIPGTVAIDVEHWVDIGPGSAAWFMADAWMPSMTVDYRFCAVVPCLVGVGLPVI